MYFPFMRAKQNEILALRELKNVINESNNVTPIIESVKNSSSQNRRLLRLLEEFEESELPFIVIINPTVGDFRQNNSVILNEIIPEIREKGSCHILGYVITHETSANDISEFLEFAGEDNICFIHAYEFVDYELISNLNNLTYQIFLHNGTNLIYRNRFPNGNKVIVEDGFNKQVRNADYPPDESFLDLNLTFHENGYAGFGDYLIVGREYRAEGGPAHAVTIHITYIKHDGALGIKHYISDQTLTTADTPGKYFEALTKLIREKNNSPTLLDTSGLRDFQTNFDNGHFPGLGVVKKQSMKHHIELIARTI